MATQDQEVEFNVFVCKYTGLKIYQTEDGFCAQNGFEYAADNEPTLEDAKASIDQYWKGEQFGPLNGFFN